MSDPSVWNPSASDPPVADVPLALRPFVLSIGGYAADGLSPGVHRGLPSPTLTMVFSVGDPVRTASTWQDWRRGRMHAQPVVLGGLHTSTSFVDQPGRWCGVQVGLHPLGARRLFGLPASALPVDVWDARDLLGNQVDEASERLASATSWRHRYAVVTDLLTAWVATERHGDVRPEIAEAWRCLVGTGGRTAVSDLAGQVGYSRRRLTDLFRAETGVSPKTAARLVRFDAARRALSGRAVRGLPLELSEVAASHGYYDHPHLVRDFTAFSGLSPTAWLREEFPNIQAGQRSVTAS